MNRKKWSNRSAPAEVMGTPRDRGPLPRADMDAAGASWPIVLLPCRKARPQNSVRPSLLSAERWPLGRREATPYRPGVEQIRSSGGEGEFRAVGDHLPARRDDGHILAEASYLSPHALVSPGGSVAGNEVEVDEAETSSERDGPEDLQGRRRHPPRAALGGQNRPHLPLRGPPSPTPMGKR